MNNSLLLKKQNKSKDLLKKVFAFIFVAFVSLNIQATIDPGTDFDLNTHINERLDAGETTIIIEPGRYRVPANGSYHILIKDRNDVTIIADGVEMICTETVQAIQIKNCNNLKIQGLSIDYDPLPFTQGRIVEISPEKTSLTVDLIDGYSSTITGGKLEVFDAVTGELTASTYYGVTYLVNTETKRAIITKDARNWDTMVEKVGDIVVLDSQNTRKIPHTIKPDGCIGLVLENLTVYAGTTFAFFEVNCSGSKYINCKVDRRPLESDIIPREVRRMRSNNADAFHSKYAEVGPLYDGCIARYNGDDGIAINGDFHIITESNDNVLTVVGKGGVTPELYVNDIVELVSYTGERIPDAQIISIETGRSLNFQELNFLQTQTFNGAADNTYQATNVYNITINRSVNLPMGSLINAANRIGNNFEVRNCILGPNRSRGILVKSSHGVIKNNTCVNNWGQAIKLAPEYNWLEAGSGSDILISDNTISGCHDASIAIHSKAGDGNTAPAGAHDAIQIINNNISQSSNPGIAVTSTTNLCIDNNTISDPNNDLLLPWYMNNFGRNEDANREIYLENVTQIGCDIILSSDSIDFKKKISVFPNPTNTFINIIFEENYKNPSIKLIDVSGRLLLEQSLNNTSQKLNVENLSKGVYFLQINNNGKLIDIHKIIINK